MQKPMASSVSFLRFFWFYSEVFWWFCLFLKMFIFVLGSSFVCCLFTLLYVLFFPVFFRFPVLTNFIFFDFVFFVLLNAVSSGYHLGDVNTQLHPFGKKQNNTVPVASKGCFLLVSMY